MLATADSFALSAPPSWPKGLMFIARARRNIFSAWGQQAYADHDARHTVMGRTLVIATSEAMRRFVLEDDGVLYRLSPVQARLLGPALGRGVITAEGEAWARERKDSHAVIRDAGLGRTAEVTRRHLQPMLDRLTGPGIADLETDLGAAFLAMMVEILFRETVEPDQAAAMAADVDHYLDIAGRFEMSTFLGLPAMPWEDRSRIDIARRYDSIVQSRADGRFQRDRKGTRDFVINLMSGFKSTSLAYLWTLVSLAQRPQWANICREELGGLEDGASVLRPVEAPNLHAVLNEAQRLFPPLPIVVRRAVTSHESPAGPVRKGDVVFVSAYVIHRHEAYWPDPNAFRPERFLGEKPSALAFAPFGQGPRRCPGAAMGAAILTEALAQTLRHGIPRLISSPPSVQGSLTLRPDRKVVMRLEGAALDAADAAIPVRACA